MYSNIQSLYKNGVNPIKRNTVLRFTCYKKNTKNDLLNIFTMNEDQLTAASWTILWNEYQELRHHMWHVPNGGSRDAREGMKFKAMGVLEGVWDWHCYFHCKFFIIEFKVGLNGLTVDRIDDKGKKHFGQREWGDRMELHGACKFVCKSTEDLRNVLDYIISTAP